MIILKALWGRVWPYVALIGTGIAAFVGIRQSGKSAGKREVQQEINQEQAKAREKAREVDNKVDAMGDDAVRDSGRQWVRRDPDE